MDRFKQTKEPHRKRVALWKWVVVILLIVAMPMFFSFYRTAQTRNAINATHVH